MGKENVANVRRLLLVAYDAGKRDLPWRGETDPYRIWVSEVMLQQTRVETVIPYYGRWLERFPDVDTLADAEEDEVLRVWQGLGYYSRARRLHQGAQLVRERYAGALPQNSEELQELPGVGQYTAGAVASIAFGEVVPAVDGNVKRVLSRLLDLPEPSQAELRETAGEFVDPDRPGDFNQALMELGALTCLPRRPRCDACPLESECLALERGTVGMRPAPKPKKKVPEVAVKVLVVVARDETGEAHLLLRKRPDSGLLAGMWEFPEMEAMPDPGADSATNLAATNLAATNLAATSVLASDPPFTNLDVVPHTFSHLKIRYKPFLLQVAFSPPSGPDPEGIQWIPVDELPRVPLPVAQKKIAEMALRDLSVV